MEALTALRFASPEGDYAAMVGLEGGGFLAGWRARQRRGGQTSQALRRQIPRMAPTVLHSSTDTGGSGRTSPLASSATATGVSPSSQSTSAIGGTPASTTPADYPRLTTRISYPTSCTSPR
jgi:hypothetical protein